jgi:hypothetical protein
MKIRLQIIILLISTLSVFAQQASEIDPKFIKLPRYADLTAINTAIPSPTQGMMVYNIGTASNWYYNGTAWTNTAGGAITAPLSLNLSAIVGTTISGIHTNSGAAGAIGGIGVRGESIGGQSGAGILGIGQDGNYGVWGYSPTYFGVYGTGAVGGYFNGTTNALRTSGALQFGGSGVGTIAAGKVLTATDALGNATWQNSVLTLPYNGTSTSLNPSIEITNNVSVPISATDVTTAIKGIYSGNLQGTPPFESTSQAAGVYGLFNGTSLYPTPTGSGVYGKGNNGSIGVKGVSSPNSFGSSGIGVLGFSNYIGVEGESTNGYGGYFLATTGTAGGFSSTSGTAGSFTSTSGNAGYFTSSSGNALITGSGKVGIGTSSPSAKLEVYSSPASGATTAAITGTNDYGTGTLSIGVYGVASNTSPLPPAPSLSTVGVYGNNMSTNANGIGVFGYHAGGGIGVRGTSANGIAGSFNNASASKATVSITNAVDLANALDITGGIKVSGTNKAAFKVVTGPFIAGNKSGILNTTMANASTDILIVTYEYTGGSYLNKQFATFWNGGNWEIHLTDSSAMPVGITFNVLVIKQ